jgi:hypothetical protein
MTDRSHRATTSGGLLKQPDKHDLSIDPGEIHTIRARNFVMARRTQQRLNLLNQR